MKKGFTLIELLVVVAIISLLTTISLGSLNESRKSARDARRITDIKSITNALELYATSNDGIYPQQNTDSQNWGVLATSDLTEGFPNGTLPVDPLNTTTYHYTYVTPGITPLAPCGGSVNPKYVLYFVAERTDFGLPTYGTPETFCVTP